MKLMRIVAVAAGILFCCAAFAQEGDLLDESAQTSVQEPVKAREVYCEIVSYSRGFFSNKTSVSLDFGQYANFWSNDRKIVDERGNVIDFNSMLDAANYMAERGWVFKQAYIVQSISKGESNEPTYHWILAKTITDPSQITEGILTSGMVNR